MPLIFLKVSVSSVGTVATAWLRTYQGDASDLGLQVKKEGWELNARGLLREAFQGTRLFSLMMENFCTCFPLQLQIICQNKADATPSRLCLPQTGRRSEASLGCLCAKEEPLHCQARLQSLYPQSHRGFAGWRRQTECGRGWIQDIWEGWAEKRRGCNALH